MRVAVTGATGFLGRYIVNHLLARGHACRGTWRPGHSDRGGFIDGPLEWVPFELGDPAGCGPVVQGVDAVVHAALHRQGAGFRGAEGDLIEFVERNLVGTLRLIRAAIDAGVGRFIFISTCAVHEVILPDRPLDEAHPLWPTSHYGAHKAAIEKFVHSFGLGGGYPICALRPVGIYGLARPPQASKWFDLVRAVKAGEAISTPRGGKEVYAGDVARAVEILLHADGIAGQAYNCCDGYVADEEVARIARELCGSDSPIASLNRGPKNQIDTRKLQALGMVFGGRERLRATVAELLALV